MILCFDTSVLIALEREDKKIKEECTKLSLRYPQPATISFMAYYEFILGLTGRNPKNRNQALAFINEFAMLQPTKETATLLAELKKSYDKKGISIPLPDLFIAAQVIENHMILVTKDNDFEKIQELRKITLF